MADGKKSFIVYTDWKKYIDELNDKQVGQWIRWMFEYCNDKWKGKDSEIKYPNDTAVKVLCKMTKDILKRDLVKYENKVESIARAREHRQKREEINNENNIEIKDENNADSNVCNMLNDNCNMLFVEDKSSYKEKDIKEKTPTSRFIPPTLEEVTAYCDERNNLVNPESFINFYESKGWMVGKNKMKDWKAAVRTWEKEAGFKSDNKDDNCGFEVL